MQLILTQCTLCVDQFSICHPLNFSTSAGELTLIRGANGVGKTSLLKKIARAAYKDQTICLYQKHNKLNLSDYCHYIGHTYAFHPQLTLLENLQFWCRFLKAPITILHELIHTLNLTALLNVLFSQLSFGQKKRASLARLWISPRPVWLLDEPFTGLDQDTTLFIEAAITKHLAHRGLVLLTSHQFTRLTPTRDIYLTSLLPC